MVFNIILQPEDGFKVEPFKNKLIEFVEKEFNGYISYDIIVDISKKKGIDVSIPNMTRFEILKYIKNKENYNFSIREIIDHFMGKDAWNQLSHNTSASIRIRLERIRKTIAKEENGEWTYDMLYNHEKRFVFKPYLVTHDNTNIPKLLPQT